jgi:hypothetical protein
MVLDGSSMIVATRYGNRTTMMHGRGHYCRTSITQSLVRSRVRSAYCMLKPMDNITHHCHTGCFRSVAVPPVMSHEESATVLDRRDSQPKSVLTTTTTVGITNFTFPLGATEWIG